MPSTRTIPSVAPMSNHPAQAVVLVAMLYVTSSLASSSVADAVMPTSASSAALSESVLADASVSVVAPTAFSLVESVTVTAYWTVEPLVLVADRHVDHVVVVRARVERILGSRRRGECQRVLGGAHGAA